MIVRLQSRYSLLLLTLLVVLLYWISRSAQLPSRIQDENARSALPDYILEDFSAMRTNRDGVTRHLLSAKRMVHYSDGDVTDLEFPVFFDTEPGKPPLRVDANRARMTADGKDVQLTDNVRILRSASDKRGETIMTTDFLHFFPDEGIARTDRPVVITEANAVVRAIGMEIDNRTQVTRLLSQVKVVHAKAR
ncbi:LPS export ABC transporter periplasmic protein LptC [Nitrosovibrio sp. Nv17]|uniref:LPS export ABC transporter periplasmic protein LptC n=1 Tax=Nitrosovibrio sp. Nv17 TaxID=1855339 RepID=UPI000908AC29|nr:LPS export ABC transporter periplasmic protein LptC [Nitrosovibrio sp. Nv17]SFW23515.1 lipopolysaccharide export system protein LptC [Nitrosovibrio sp. Nv17]